jgi:hypothetical protein
VPRQIDEDNLTMGCEPVKYRAPGLAPMPDSVQKHQWFARPDPLVGQPHMYILPLRPLKSQSAQPRSLAVKARSPQIRWLGRMPQAQIYEKAPGALPRRYTLVTANRPAKPRGQSVHEDVRAALRARVHDWAERRGEGPALRA